MSPTLEARFPSVGDFVAALGLSGARLPSRAPPQLLDDDDYDEDDPAFPPQPSRWRWIPAGVLTLVALGAVVAPWLLSSGSRGGQRLGSGEAYMPPPVDSFAFAEPAGGPPDTAVPVPAAPVVRAPVRMAPAPRPSAAPSPRARTVPGAAHASSLAAPGRLFVSATPWGQLYVDGELIGNTPRADVPVSPGAHQVRVVRDGFLPYEATIRIASGQELRITDVVLQEIKP